MSFLLSLVRTHATDLGPDPGWPSVGDRGFCLRACHKRRYKVPPMLGESQVPTPVCVSGGQSWQVISVHLNTHGQDGGWSWEGEGQSKGATNQQ